MIPADYFDRVDTPAKNSPVGKLIRKTHAGFPHLDLETVREESRAALYGVGGENRISITFNHVLRSQKLDKAPRRAPGKPQAHALETAVGARATSGQQVAANV